MNLRIGLRVCTMAIVALCLTSPGHGLVMVGQGNDPVNDAGWPTGALALANLESRVGWYEGPGFGGGQWTFAYRGDADAGVEPSEELLFG
jgi:hypothetical protein